MTRTSACPSCGSFLMRLISAAPRGVAANSRSRTMSPGRCSRIACRAWIGSVSGKTTNSPSSARRSRSDGIRLEAAITTAGADIDQVYQSRRVPRRCESRSYNDGLGVRTVSVADSPHTGGETVTVLHAVLFDLDDTLFDHRLCSRTALTAFYEAYDTFRSRPFAEVERLHA